MITRKIYYKTNFRLTRDVTDFEAAKKYLTEDDMTKYLLDRLNSDNMPKEEIAKVIGIEWILETPRKGYIMLTTNDYLSEETLDYISRWISGQNSDGLGEGFEQQYFARSISGRAYASFVWQQEYKFKIIENNQVRENNRYKSNHIKRINELPKFIKENNALIDAFYKQTEPDDKNILASGNQGNFEYGYIHCWQIDAPAAIFGKIQGGVYWEVLGCNSTKELNITGDCEKYDDEYTKLEKFAKELENMGTGEFISHPLDNTEWFIRIF